ncbi:hypothetical protein IB234_19225 [Pseudomonas sp. PDM16]|uniref:hypothetical protein n=1 Tax=Pseudomonas sp. PDM16 TaxID=2769292 RepID=UPI0017867992|nr:hypothetical protein [Pseudomonas sp. PDM16]MBD9416701.1 hypothetical protein [Pseudomonas sp. PDM16]
MVSIPKFTSFSVVDPASNKLLRATEIDVERTVGVDEVTKEEVTIETSNVRISEEAYDKLKFERQAELIKSQKANSESLVISQGVKIDNPNVLSEEESKALLDSLNEDPLTRMYREIDERLQVIDGATAELRTTTEKLDHAYDGLMERIGQHRPDIASKSFGFSINAESRIVLLDGDSLNAEQADYLEKVLNGSNALVSGAIDIANAHISLTEAEWWSRGLVFNRDNYAKTIDIGADLSYRRAAKTLPRGADYIPPAPVNVQDHWRQQLANNGERARY